MAGVALLGTPGLFSANMLNINQTLKKISPPDTVVTDSGTPKPGHVDFEDFLAGAMAPQKNAVTADGSDDASTISGDRYPDGSVKSDKRYYAMPMGSVQPHVGDLTATPPQRQVSPDMVRSMYNALS